MIELKTSTLLATAFKIGALIGGAHSADANAIYQFGLRLGVSFQLKDDWLDTFGDAGKFGKQPGGDIIQNKKTLLLIEALKKADQRSRSELLRWYADRPADPQEKLKSVTTIYRDLRIDEIILASVEEHFNFALKWLEDLSLSKHQKERLAALAHRLLNRQY
jgi:geranylgeranyl diphosphate synthase type II